ncbi:MAG: hypothetical protein ASARMPRED_005282 [Alectoria sarmentosa]|nr:MAG: hypothetical protein ASARMPRED_005282 [Alectoria sarmentosa]
MDSFIDISTQFRKRLTLEILKLQHQSSKSIALFAVFSIILCFITKIVYNVYLHPLAAFPGPFWARASLFWRVYYSMGGRFHRVIETQHQKYGPVFRVSPNELSFATSSSFKTIYSNPIGKPKVPKSEFYDTFGSGFSEACLASEKDPQRAGVKRGLFSGAFSAKALQEQEVVLQRCINDFVGKLGRVGGKTGGVNMVKWFEMNTLNSIAGGETTATSLAATTFNFLKSPDSHQLLKDEIRGRYNSVEEIDISSALQLPYLQAVIKEGMRIFPASSQGVPRTSPGILVDGVWVPPGTELYVSSWTVAHDSRYFHDPMVFKPERWLDPDCKDLKEASQPFSLGPRACIGRNFAYAQMSLELAKILFRPLDNVMAHCYQKFLICLSVKSNQNVNDVHMILEQGMTMTIAQMPILGGKVLFRSDESEGGRPGQLEVRVPVKSEYRLPMKDMTKELDFDDLSDAGFPEEDMDGIVFLPGAFDLHLAAGLDVITAQANFVKGGCLLGFGVWHTVSDAYGAYNIGESWSKNCKKVKDQTIAEADWHLRTASLDREILTKLWLKEGNPALKLEDFKTPSSDSAWRFLGLHPMKDVIPPEDQITARPATDALATDELQIEKSEPEKAQVMKTCIFYVSASSYANLKRAVTPETVTGNLGVSGNDAINALLWRSIMAARIPPGSAKDQNQETHYNIALDARAQFSSEDLTSYLGNVIFFATVSLPLSKVTSPSAKLSDLAFHMREILDTYTSAKVHEAFAIASSIPDYTKLSYTFAGLEGATMNVSSTLNVPLFDLDFGSSFGNGGVPEAIRILKDELDSVFRRAMVMPFRKSGGFEILISLLEDEMERLLANPEFKEYAQFSCF